VQEKTRVAEMGSGCATASAQSKWDERCNWAIFVASFGKIMVPANWWNHFNSSNPCPIPADPDHPTETEKQEMKGWDCSYLVAQYLLNQHLWPSIQVSVGPGAIPNSEGAMGPTH